MKARFGKRTDHRKAYAMTRGMLELRTNPCASKTSRAFLSTRLLLPGSNCRKSSFARCEHRIVHPFPASIEFPRE